MTVEDLWGLIKAAEEEGEVVFLAHFKASPSPRDALNSGRNRCRKYNELLFIMHLYPQVHRERQSPGVIRPVHLNAAQLFIQSELG